VPRQLQRDFIVCPEQLAEAETGIKWSPAPVLMSGLPTKGRSHHDTSAEAATRRPVDEQQLQKFGFSME